VRSDVDRPARAEQRLTAEYVSARALADIVSGRDPEPDFRFRGAARRARGVLVPKPSTS